MFFSFSNGIESVTRAVEDQQLGERAWARGAKRGLTISKQGILQSLTCLIFLTSFMYSMKRSIIIFIHSVNFYNGCGFDG